MKTFYLTQGGISKNINFRENEWIEWLPDWMNEWIDKYWNKKHRIKQIPLLFILVKQT